MKYFLIFCVVALLTAVILLNIKTTKEKKEIMAEKAKAKIEKTDSIQVIEEEPLPQNLFPEIYDYSELSEDKSLDIIRFEIKTDSIETFNNEFTLTFNLPKKVKKVDVILLVNQIKKDIFYQIEPGKYEFRRIKLNEGINLMEVFYRIGKRKSTSSIIKVIKKENEKVELTNNE